VPKLVWRVKLVAELRPGEVTETEVARIERDEQAGTADLGLRLAETRQLMAALQDQIVPAQVAVAGERCCSCVSCGRRLASKGFYPVRFHSLFAMCRFASDDCLCLRDSKAGDRAGSFCPARMMKRVRSRRVNSPTTSASVRKVRPVGAALDDPHGPHRAPPHSYPYQAKPARDPI
jgi:hypothetical protein